MSCAIIVLFLLKVEEQNFSSMVCLIDNFLVKQNYRFFFTCDLYSKWNFPNKLLLETNLDFLTKPITKAINQMFQLIRLVFKSQNTLRKSESLDISLETQPITFSIVTIVVSFVFSVKACVSFLLKVLVSF